jgi:uncharacterized protein
LPVFGALGDIHGDFDSARRLLRRHPDVPFWLCVGDVANDEGQYEAVPAPMYWIKGNNENFDAIAQATFPDNVRFLQNARPQRIDGIHVVGLGGTLAPTLYETPAVELPHPKKGSLKATQLADRRRHFVREEVDACKALRDIDVFLTHEAPRPFKVGRIEAGKAPVNEVLAAVRPRLHLFGHHHRFSELTLGGVKSVGLDLVSTSYLLIDKATLEYEVRS